MTTTRSTPTPSPAAPKKPTAPSVPPLVAGDRLTRDEFERRYSAMPHVKKAELIEGKVYMPSPVSTEGHASPHFLVIAWLGGYQAKTPGIQGGDNGTVRLDLDNEPQPDVFLRILPTHGGQSRISDDDYVEGAPELVVEVTATTAAYDLHDKLNAYRRNGVREYVVWRTQDEDIDWFILRGGQYERLQADEQGVTRSEVFPGLRLDTKAMLASDLARVLDVLQQGLASDAHRAFVDQLKSKSSEPK
jgi:Uma2 family endonuclease